MCVKQDAFWRFFCAGKCVQKVTEPQWTDTKMKCDLSQMLYILRDMFVRKLDCFSKSCHFKLGFAVNVSLFLTAMKNCSAWPSDKTFFLWQIKRYHSYTVFWDHLAIGIADKSI